MTRTPPEWMTDSWQDRSQDDLIRQRDEMKVFLERMYAIHNRLSKIHPVLKRSGQKDKLAECVTKMGELDRLILVMEELLTVMAVFIHPVEP